LGILIGPYILRLVPDNLIKATDLVGYFVLSLIAFSLGENFLWREFRRIGREVVVISLAAVLAVLILVSLALWLIGQELSTAIILGAIATATAPMTTVMVIREYRAKGPFTTALLDIVAIDDAWGIIAFAITVAIAKLLTSPLNVGNPLILASAEAFREIFGALILGLILGVLLSILSRYVRGHTISLIYTLGFILVTTGISLHLKFSPLLANMTLGAAVINLTRKHLFFEVLHRIDWPFYLLFFVLCGASLQIPFLKELSLLGIIYVVARILGKYVGVYLGGQISHAEVKVKRYLGFGLIPQAGVALGLAIIAKAELPSIGNLVFTTIIATTVIFELIGPFGTRFAITKAEEMGKAT